MMDEPFANGNSRLHQTGPGVKIIVCALFIAIIATSSDYPVVITGLALSLVLVAVARLDLKQVAKRVVAANIFTLFLWITLPLTYPGSEFERFGFLSFSKAGIELALLITLKTNCVVLAIIGLLATSTVASLGHGLEGLKIPKRLCFLLLFSYRYISVIHQEYLRLRRAARLRCFVPDTSTHTYRTYGYLFGMTLVKSWNRATRVQQAMVLRGFSGTLIPLKQQALGKGDFIFLLLSLLVVFGLALLGLL